MSFVSAPPLSSRKRKPSLMYTIRVGSCGGCGHRVTAALIGFVLYIEPSTQAVRTFPLVELFRCCCEAKASQSGAANEPSPLGTGPEYTSATTLFLGFKDDAVPAAFVHNLAIGNPPIVVGNR